MKRLIISGHPIRNLALAGPRLGALPTSGQHFTVHSLQAASGV
ncbi:hypothetical protein [Ochrobactrum sp. AN78]|nr:hypothetical protein [Ochrobactrum sp. AN78]MDH7791236.1 hypothetical protein [Ochrobactrum sp. AN78]